MQPEKGSVAIGKTWRSTLRPSEDERNLECIIEKINIKYHFVAWGGKKLCLVPVTFLL